MDTVIDEDALVSTSKEAIVSKRHDMWRFAMFLPIETGKRVVSGGEGETPLNRLYSLKGNVWVKNETRNPTGTFKDRGAALAITRLSQLGVKRVVLSSEGNAGCSFALYSQMAGIQCHVFLPRQANPAKVKLTRLLGARVTQVSGTIADAGLRAAESSRKTGAYNASTFVTPYRHDGKGTIAHEICEQRGWKAPDWVVYPIGGGVGLVGMWKMFKILNQIGWISNTPRFVAVQPSGCAPVVKAYNSGKDDVEDWKSPKTIALGLQIPRPLAGRWILRSLRESDGIAVTVSDLQIHRSVQTLAKTEGLLLEPSSAAAFAALPRLYEDAVVERDEEVVVIATGSGLKTIDNL